MSNYQEKMSQQVSNLSYIMGMYGGMIKILIDELNSLDASKGYVNLAEDVLKKGEKIFNEHGERHYNDIVSEMSSK